MNPIVAEAISPENDFSQNQILQYSGFQALPVAALHLQVLLWQLIELGTRLNEIVADLPFNFTISKADN